MKTVDVSLLIPIIILIPTFIPILTHVSINLFFLLYSEKILLSPSPSLELLFFFSIAQSILLLSFLPLLPM